jgi:AcrR family transcriptional regulator
LILGFAVPAPASSNRSRRPVRKARQARSRATVEAIVEAAARILAEQGWQGLNTNTVARRAGVSVGSVYEYFPDKQAIVWVIMDRHLSRAEALLQTAESSPAGALAPGSIPAFLAASFIGLHQEDPKLHRVLSSEVPVTEELTLRVQDMRSRAVGLVTTALSGQVPSPELKAAVLVDTADALAHRWVIDGLGAPVSPAVMLTELTTLLTNYIAAPAN